MIERHVESQSQRSGRAHRLCQQQTSLKGADGTQGKVVRFSVATDFTLVPQPDQACGQPRLLHPERFDREHAHFFRVIRHIPGEGTERAPASTARTRCLRHNGVPPQAEVCERVHAV